MNAAKKHFSRRGRARRNKENLALNRGEREKLSGQPKPDLARLALKRKSRTKKGLLAGALPLAKRYSMQRETEGHPRTHLADKSGVLNSLRRKMSTNYSTHEDARRNKLQNWRRQPGQHLELKSSDKEALARMVKGKRKTKAFSSNNFALSRILRVSHWQEETWWQKKGKRDKAEKKSKSGGQNQSKLLTRALGEKNRRERERPSKPPLLAKQGNYSSVHAQVKRGRAKGFLRRKMSMGVAEVENSCGSKLRSPGGLQSRFPGSPRYFETMDRKGASAEAKGLEFVPAPKFFAAEGGRGKKEKLKKILARKRREGLAELAKKTSQNSICEKEVKRASAFSGFGLKIDGVEELKTPVNDVKGERRESPRQAQSRKKAKKLFSFNKDSEVGVKTEREAEGKAVANNTSLLYACALNSSKTQNSFVLLKNRMVSGREGARALDTSLHFRVDSLKNGSILATGRASGTSQSFLQRVRRDAASAKTRSFFETERHMKTIPAPERSMPRISRPSQVSEEGSSSQTSDGLSEFIESMQRQRGSVHTIEEESEDSPQQKIQRRLAPTLKGRLIRFRGIFGGFACADANGKSAESGHSFPGNRAVSFSQGKEAAARGASGSGKTGHAQTRGDGGLDFDSGCGLSAARENACFGGGDS